MYRQLNESTVIQYLKKIPKFESLINNFTTAKEVGDGNLNFVYFIEQLNNSEKLVIKQAVPYLRCVGESYSLAKERMLFESKSLLQFAAIVPKHVPKIYHVDNEMSLVVMQCLDKHIIMRKGLIAEKVYSNFAEHIASFLSEVLFKTSSLYLSGKEKRILMQNYIANDELCKITEDFVFTCPYMQHETNPVNQALEVERQRVQEDDLFKLEALILKNKFMNQTDALLHGDLHTGSIMINQEETYVIDSEFAFYGPYGFDLGAMLANLLLAWVSHFERSNNKEYQKWLIDTAIGFYQKFEEKFLTLWNQHQGGGLVSSGFCSEILFQKYKKHYLLEILQDTIGYAGLKMARRILGIAGVAEIKDIQNEQARVRAEKFALNIAKELVKNRKAISNIFDVLPILQQEQQKYEQQRNYKAEHHTVS